MTGSPAKLKLTPARLDMLVGKVKDAIKEAFKECGILDILLEKVWSNLDLDANNRQLKAIIANNNAKYDMALKTVVDQASCTDQLRELLNEQVEINQRVSLERKNWEETAAQYARNQIYYQDKVSEIGSMFGLRAFIADDGSVGDSVLAEKVPSLVAELIINMDLNAQEA